MGLRVFHDRAVHAHGTFLELPGSLAIAGRDARRREQGRDAQALCAAFVEKHQQHAGQRPSRECLTRFLCGVPTPLFTKLKARQLAGFAALEEYPYAEVRGWLGAM